MKALLALAASLLVSAPALAADNTLASLNWRLDFGAHTLEAGYGLSLGYRGSEHFAPLSKLIELKVDGANASAAIGGFSFAARSYQANQSEADQAYDAGVDTRPWYSRSWVYWTLGGVAATVALAGSGGSASYGSSNTTNNNTGCAGVSSNGTNPDIPDACAPTDQTVGCAPGTSVCAVCGGGVITDQCGGGWAGLRVSEVLVERLDDTWLDEGTGHMGDLTEVQP